MYNLMIVDDDRLVRRRIQSAIPFEQLELQLCGEAEDGIQALELFKQCHPQIVIMDINIPFVNGIDVSKRILEENEDVNIVIVTGYGTVDFAKEAIRSGMVDFLLKPVNVEELGQTLRRIVDNIRAKTAQTLERQRMERLLERGMPLLRSRYFQSLMNTAADELQETDCRRYLKDFGVTGAITAICTVIVCPNYSGLSVDKRMTLQAVLEEEIDRSLTGGGGSCIVLYDALQRAVVVAYGTAPDLGAALEQKLSMIRDRMRYLYQFDFHASIGSVVPEFRCLQRSYADAERALNLWNVFGSNNVVSSENVRLIKQERARQTVFRYGDLMQLMTDGDLSRLQAAISEYLNALVAESQGQLPLLQQKGMELLALVAACTEELGGVCDKAMAQEPYARLLYADGVGQIRKLVLDTAAELLAGIGSSRERSSRRAIACAKQYIREHYAEADLNLAKVAEQVQLSPSYVSQLFQKSEERGFTDYLNQVRVEAAKELLRTTHMRVYEVAEAVGYQNSKYFFPVFKQITGKRPREFYENAGGSAAETK